MKIAVGLPQIASDPDAAVRAAVAAEDAGAWGVWAFENLAPLAGPDRPVLEGWSLLAGVAAATSRVRLVSLVTRAGLRPPALVARMTAVVSAASGGRFVLGLGAGDAASRGEERRFGIDAPGARSERFTLMTDTITALTDAMLRPRIAPPEVWIGGLSDDLIELAARRAQAWHGWGLDAESFAQRAARVRATAPQIECWWGGMFDPQTAEATLADLRASGATGITWMIASRRDEERRPLLLDLVRSVR